MCSDLSTYRNGVDTDENGNVLKKKKNIVKGENVKTFVAYELWYQDGTGEAECKACRSNKKPGAGFCDEETGAIACLGIYEEESKCKTKQKIEQSIALAYTFFGLLVTLGVPFMFFSGGLGAISHLWRKDIAVLVRTMREGTQHGLFLMKQRTTEHKRRVRDAGVRAAFAEHTDSDDRASLAALRFKLELVGLKGSFVKQLAEDAAAVARPGRSERGD